MNQALLTALQTTVNEKNIIVLVPFQCPEDDLIAACQELIKAAEESKIARAQAEAQAKADAESITPEVVA